MVVKVASKVVPVRVMTVPPGTARLVLGDMDVRVGAAIALTLMVVLDAP